MVTSGESFNWNERKEKEAAPESLQQRTQEYPWSLK